MFCPLMSSRKINAIELCYYLGIENLHKDTTLEESAAATYS